IGAAACEGDLVAFLDADDQWDRTKLEDQIAILNADPRLVALGSLMRYMSPNGRTMGIAGQVIGTSEQALVQSARLMPFPISSLLVRRSAFEAVGGFAEDLSDPNGAWAEDLSFVAEIARKGQIATVPRVLGSYRLHTGSVSARHQAAIARGKRFVRARLAARDRGEELSYEDFSATYRPSLLQRHGDWVQGCYRRAGLNRAIERPAAATAWGALAFACSPRYTTKRLLLQRARVGG
ncbi:MAG: glycosyltransferase family 2 protein, partial [bacterium]